LGASARAIAGKAARAADVRRTVSNRTLVALPHLVAIFLSFAPSAHGRTLDRVAAVVGGRVIMLSEVREAATPWLANVRDQDALARARAEAKVLHETCERMIDDALVQDEAERLHVTTSDQEVTRAIGQVAQTNHVSVEQLMAVAVNQGFDEKSYRASVRAQVLALRVLQQIGTDPQKYDEALGTLHVRLREKTYVEDRLAP
jgi:peptidyl-prolyl cis-trans isomerase SurA